MFIKLLKAILFLLIAFVVIFILGLAQAQTPNNQGTPSIPPDLFNSLLVMAGGGGIGSLGASLMSRHQQHQQQINQPLDSSGFNVTVYTLDEKIKELERRQLRELEVVRTALKEVKSKINAIEFFIGQKYPDFKRKDTLH